VNVRNGGTVDRRALYFNDEAAAGDVPGVSSDFLETKTNLPSYNK